jgi:MoaA/NifB/PqqE/SkfB family radical SAM enzyme
LVTFAEELGQVTGILTDGRRLSDANYVEVLFQAGIDHFLITLIPDSDESLEGIKNALASDVFTAIHLTLIESSVDEARGWLDQLHEMEVPAVSISTSDSSEEGKNTLASAREYAAELEMDLIWDIQAPYSKHNPIALEVDEAASGAGRAWLYVEPDGDVLPAQGVDMILGNLLNDEWEDIWTKAKDIEN